MDDIDSADKEDIIISSLIDMSKRMGLKVLCEGVENAEQVDFLAGLVVHDMSANIVFAVFCDGLLPVTYLGACEHLMDGRKICVFVVIAVFVFLNCLLQIFPFWLYSS